MKLTEIPASQLRLSEKNVRTTPADKQADKELKASIGKHGVLQNLVVQAGQDGEGQFDVHAGGRRLRAVNALIEEGALDPDTTLPCILLDANASAEEISLAENLCRADMHPIDQLQAFNRLSKASGGTLTVKDLAAHFGKSQADVRKILALGSCAPELLLECHKGRMDVDTLRAFSIQPDQARQVQAYNALRDSGTVINDYTVRAMLSEHLVRESDTLAVFVGLDAYRKAGGGTQKDLFQDETYLTDKILLQELANKKLQESARQLEDEGWASVEIDVDADTWELQRARRLPGTDTEETAQLREKLDELSRELAELENNDDLDVEAVFKEERRIDDEMTEIEAQIQDSVEYSDDDREHSGVVLTIDERGKLRPVRALIAEDTPAKSEPPAKPSDKPKYSMSLVSDLMNYKTEIARLALVNEPDFAVQILHFQVVHQLLAKFGYISPLSLRYNSTEEESTRKDMPSQPARKQRRRDLEKLLQEEKVRGLVKAIEDESSRDEEAFEQYLALPERLQQKLLSHAVAYSLKQETEHNKYPAYILEVTGHAMSEFWRPTTTNFFGRVSKDTCIEIAREIMGETWAEANAGLPKKDLGIRIEEECQEGRPGQGFIPEPMRHDLEEARQVDDGEQVDTEEQVGSESQAA